MPVLPRTPCIGICSTGIGDDVCRGCKRFAQEVIDWNSYSAEERRAVMKRIDGFLVQVVRTKFSIVNVQCLQQQIEFQQIPFDREKDPYSWLFELLRWGAGQIHALEDYGVQLTQDDGAKTLTEVKADIDKEVYELACAYYQRYVVPGQMAKIVADELL